MLPSTDLGDAAATLAALAAAEPESEPALRVARVDRHTLVELDIDDDRVLRLTPEGPRMIAGANARCTFARTAASLPVHIESSPSAALDELLAIVLPGMSTDATAATLAWLLGSWLLPTEPTPVLWLGGPQGSGKSATARTLVMLADPNRAPGVGPPRDELTAVALLAPARARVFDNLSACPVWLSDALCRATTGETHVARRLYTDAEVHLLDLRRAIVVTSIGSGPERADLASRTWAVELAPPSDRVTEGELARRFSEHAPRLRGALAARCCDVLAVLRDRADELPAPASRLADFEGVLAAHDLVRGSALRAAWLAAQDDALAAAPDSDEFAGAIIAFTDEHGPTGWEGTAAELLRLLELATPESRRGKGWPENAHRAGGRLTRALPALEAVGISVERARTGRTRTITLRRPHG